MTHHRVFEPLTGPFLFAVRDPHGAAAWHLLGEFDDLIAARKAARSLRRFWPWIAVRISYPRGGE